MKIQTNVASLNAIDSSSINNSKAVSSLEKLSSGLQINKASDDASGLAIADKLRTQVSSISQSIDNANSAVSMIQIADKAMGEQSNILDIIKQKLIQSATDTTSSDGRKALAKDMNKLLEQFDNIASQTNYNGVNLLQQDASTQTAANSLKFLIGETSNDIIQTTGTIRSNTAGLALSATMDLSDLKSATAGDGSSLTQADSKTFLETIDTSLKDLNEMRSNFGSTQNQIASATRNLLTQKTNIAAAESIIRVVDYSVESANFNKYSIMNQSSTFAQAQANSRPADVLKLLS